MNSRFTLRVPGIVAYSGRHYNKNAKPNDTRVTNLLAKLKSGIHFEQVNGHQNWPGRHQIFSDFLQDTLASIIEYKATHSKDAHRGLVSLLQKSQAYASMPVPARAGTLEELQRVIDRLDTSQSVNDVSPVSSGGLSTSLSRERLRPDLGDGKKSPRFVPFIFDLEATGLSPKTSHVVEICVMNGLSKESFARRVRLPEGVIMQPGASKVTGIKSEDVQGNHIPSFEEVMSEFFSFISKSTVAVGGDDCVPLLMGHNILTYDVRLLQNRLAELESEVTNGLDDFYYLDTLRLSKSLFKKAPSLKLGDLHTYLTGKAPFNAHSANGDVQTTDAILEWILLNMISTPPHKSTLEDKWNVFLSQAGKFLVPNSSFGVQSKDGPEEAGSAESDGITLASNILSRNDLLDMSGDGDGDSTVENVVDFVSLGEKSIIKELQSQIKDLGNVFSSSEQKTLAQMHCKNLKDLIYCFPKGYLAASVGQAPSRDIDVEQAIVLPVALEGINVYRGRFHILNVRLCCLDYSSALEGTYVKQGPVLEYKVFRQGRSAAWAVMNEEKRIKSMGPVFGISAQVSLNKDDKFSIKENTFEMMDMASFRQLSPSSGVYLRPLYSQKGRISATTVSTMVSNGLKYVMGIQNAVTDPIPEEIRKEIRSSTYLKSLHEIHNPQSIAAFTLSRTTLAIYQLFLLQLSLLSRTATPDMTVVDEPDLRQQELAIKALQFPLTNDQTLALTSINQIFKRQNSSSILLQGDVGCGKTIVALLAALAMIGGNGQVAFMAPTEVLAEQHLKSLESLIDSCIKLIPTFKPPRVAILTGSTKAAQKRAILERLASGDIDIIIGTHALISSPVTFENLVLAIIDEQHKFGVEQRAALLSKSNPAPHLLNMSATPIPRSLALVLYGEMDLIEIQEMPPGRIPVKTRVWRENGQTQKDLIQKIKSEVDTGGKCFVICPLIDSEKDSQEGLKTVVGEKDALCSTQELKPHMIGVLHGRMNAIEKDQILSDFANPKGDLKILISTTVVEVGVNVTDATLMVINHAERFGLAQLHQLRGRVGRGSKKSECILVSTEAGSERLNILEETNNGFRVAEADLENRGSGDIIGTAQAGQRNDSTSLWELPRDSALVFKARNAANEFIKNHGADRKRWPAHVLEALEDPSNIDLDIHQLPDFCT